MANHTTLPVQQGQASAYNHPCGDLLDGGKRREYLDIAVPLYRASIKGDLEAAKAILQDHKYLVCSITEKNDTPLHVAAAGGSTKLVRYLVSMTSKSDLELQNGDGNTAFCIAAISGNVGMVEIMLEKNQALPTICGSENMMPLYLAAYYGNHDVVTFLYNQSDRMTGNDWTDDNKYGVLLKCIQSNIFDVALQIIKDNEELPQDKHLWDVLQVLAQKPEVFKPGGREMNSPYLAFFYDASKLIVYLAIGPDSILTIAIVLLRLLWKRIMEKPKDFIDEMLRGPMTVVEKSPGQNMETYPSQILFIAAKMNNKRFLAELIDGYPDLIWKRNDDGQTIFHISVSHRHESTFNLLYEIGSMGDLVAPITDQQGNNILHLAGKEPEKTNFKDRLTSTFEVNSETYWYKKVERVLPPPCREVKNAAGQTPIELFIEQHGEQNVDDMKWINKTVDVSMVVAALVCTISFSVIYSIPGGFNQNNGFPMFLHNKNFISFIEMDVVSFIMSSSSIILFLSIVLSRHHENSKLLLQRWMAAQVLLLLSVYFLVGAFGCSFYILYRETVWTNLLNILAILITGSCTILSLRAVIDMATVTYGMRFGL